MNCQDLSRVLDSRDVNSLSADERRECEAHAASCADCGPEWTVYSRLAAIPAPPMPRQLAVRCQALAAAHMGGGTRPQSRTILLGTILIVAAAAAALIMRLTGAPPEVTVQGSVPAATAPAEASAMTSMQPRAADPTRVTNAAAVQPLTVQLVLKQATDDAIGRGFGQMVYDSSREELRSLPGLVLVDASATAAAMPSFRITYVNLSKSGGGFHFGPGGLETNPVKGNEPLRVNGLLEFTVDAFQPSADGAGTWQPVIAGGGELPMPSVFVPVECIGQRAELCPQAGKIAYLTPADLAAYCILSWYLQTTPPDPVLAGRLHEMLRDASTPPLLWEMALTSLSKYKQLRLDVAELLAAANRIIPGDPELGAELVRSAFDVGSRLDLMTQVRDLLLREPPEAGQPTESSLRKDLVRLLATNLNDEPATQGILESVAANDPSFEVRAEAKRALEQEKQR